MIRNRTLATVAASVFALALAAGAALDGATATAGAGGTGLTTASSYDDAIAKAREDQERYNAEIEKLEAELEDTDAEIVEASKKLKETESKLPAAQAAVDEATEKLDAARVQQQLVADKLAAAEAQDRAISDQISADNDKIAELQEIVAALARAEYQGVGDEQALSLVFGATTSQEFVDQFAAEHNASRVQTNALSDVEEIAAVNRNRGARQAAVREYIAELKAEADALVVETERLKADAEDKKAALDALVKEQKAIQSSLEDKREEAIAKQQAIAAKQEATRDKIKALVKKKAAEEAEARRKAEEEARRKAEEEAAKNNQSSGGSSSGGSSSGSSGGTTSGLSKGALAWPVTSKYVTSSYGMRYHPVLHYWRLHAGTDMRAYCGTPIYAARSGTVQWATYQAGLGNSVLIDHGWVGGKSLMTSYNHMTSFAVSSGAYVNQGALVGYSGNTGTSAACHLHFEVYINGDTVDPMTLVN